MNERSLKHFYDALAAAESIRRFADGRSFEDYCDDEMLSSAIERKFEIIGEALARIRRESPDDLSVISDWPGIVGFRNILAHAYDHVEDSVVWGIVAHHIPPFIVELKKIPGIDAVAD
jgi:uncharacterized protein with HEPN domain